MYRPGSEKRALASLTVISGGRVPDPYLVGLQQKQPSQHYTELSSLVSTNFSPGALPFAFNLIERTCNRPDSVHVLDALFFGIGRYPLSCRLQVPSTFSKPAACLTLSDTTIVTYACSLHIVMLMPGNAMCCTMGTYASFSLGFPFRFNPQVVCNCPRKSPCSQILPPKGTGLQYSLLYCNARSQKDCFMNIDKWN